GRLDQGAVGLRVQAHALVQCPVRVAGDAAAGEGAGLGGAEYLQQRRAEGLFGGQRQFDRQRRGGGQHRRQRRQGGAGGDQGAQVHRRGYQHARRRYLGQRGGHVGGKERPP